MVHALKVEPKHFNDLCRGIKSFEVRRKDRPFAVGDYLALNEYENEHYSGNFLLFKIMYILDDPTYCKEGYVIIAIKPCKIDEYAIEEPELVEGHR